MKLPFMLVIASVVIAPGIEANAQDVASAQSESTVWPESLITETPREGFELAVMLSRRGVTATQPDVDVLRDLRPAYANDPNALIATSHVVAVHFQTIAAANDYWRSGEPRASSQRAGEREQTARATE